MTLRERGSQFRLRPSRVLIAALIGSLLFLIWTGLNDQEQGQTDNQLSAPVAPVGASIESTAPQADVTPTFGPQGVDVQVLQARAEPVIRTYMSFPNKEGRVATIDQLRPLVSPEALAAIEREWYGPDLSTVVMNATEVRFESQTYELSADRIILAALVTQKATFEATPQQIYLPTVLVTFEPRDKKWIIVGIRELGT